ncbi:MAG TPA: ribosome small subunit-dependent GTPase A, partial [Bacteroidota bacterium]|nr:ribosome small subunit-dependent GTPase A [Bacteroidota bacterium]
MTLADLGFDEWFDKKREELKRPDCRVARISRVDRDRYLVRNEQGEAQAEVTGKLLFTAETSQDVPCVGDWVLVQYYNDGALAIIHELLPRRTYLRRKAAGAKSDFQMIAANIDVAFIMQSCDANFNVRRMERYIVMVHEGRIEPVILLSKSDLAGAGELETLTSEIRGARIVENVIPFSSANGSGLPAVEAVLERGKTYCLLGSSGVGKTTLLNHLLGREQFETAPVRETDSRGRHTTSRRELTLLEGGSLIIDTPGMRELGVMGADEAIEESFPDIHELANGCRFKDCTHTREAGCHVLEAVRT